MGFRRFTQHGTLIVMCLRTIVLLVMCVLCACSKKSAPAAGVLLRDDCVGKADGLVCSVFEEALTCRTEQVEEALDCQERGQRCIEPFGCAACVPGSYSCDGQRLLQCSSEGARSDELEVCAPGLFCSPIGCADLCERARRERSYIGCEYFPVFNLNNQLDSKFKPAVVIANPNLVAADVTITHRGKLIDSRTIAPGAVETIVLSYFSSLRLAGSSALVHGGAYHLLSSVPVTVHQFNPLLFELNEDCERNEDETGTGITGDKKCNSFSNDASLLVPAHALTREPGESLNYLAISRATMMVLKKGVPAGFSSGYVSIVNVSSQPVRVRIKSSAFTRGIPLAVFGGPSSDDPEGVATELLPALSPGDDMPLLVLEPGDVVQLLAASPSSCDTEPVATRLDPVCRLGEEYDLTGTSIEADGPVAVLGGHNCAYVPFDRVACDHLEESLFPVDTWGSQAIVARPRAGDAQPHILRVVSSEDDNLVQFLPAEVHEPVRMERGRPVEILTTEHVIVRAEKPIAVAQFLVGQNGEARVGDPSMSMAIPVEQYRSTYAFLSPATYDLNYVTIVARTGDEVILDGALVRDFQPIADGTYQVASVKLAKAGAHAVHSRQGLGIGVQVYGFGDYTSYMLPGGLDLRVLTVPF